MVQEARDLATFFRGRGAEELAKQAEDLAVNAKAAGLLSINRPPKVDLLVGLEGKIRREIITIGGKTPDQLKRKLKAGPFRLSEYAEYLIGSPDFVTKKEPEDVELIFPRVGDMGLRGIQTTDQVYRRGFDLGWNLCPAEVGPHLRLKVTDQPLGSLYWIAMKQIADRDGDPGVFRLVRRGDGLWLDGRWAGPGHVWDPRDEFVFSLRKDTPKP